MPTEDILIITPDLSLNGANVVLLELLQLFDQKQYRMWLVASEDGMFRESLEALHVKITISPYVMSDAMQAIRKHNFKFVFMNSSSVHMYALFFQNTETPVYWWFHESYEQLETSRENFVHPGMLSDNFTFLAVTDKVARGLNSLYGIRAEILPMPVSEPPDLAKGDELFIRTTDNKIRFFIPAAYTCIKGQDILCRAISRLPERYRDMSEFVFAGYKIPGQDEYFSKIQSMGKLLENVTMLDAIPREAVYQYYRQSDCVIAPSRVDSCPTTIVEALMFRKVCIVSDGTGMADYITDCEDGFVFHNGDVQELTNILIAVMDNIAELGPIAEAGRQVYERHFLPATVMQKVSLLTSGNIHPIR